LAGGISGGQPFVLPNGIHLNVTETGAFIDDGFTNHGSFDVAGDRVLYITGMMICFFLSLLFF
jgi:hypothetical protein